MALVIYGSSDDLIEIRHDIDEEYDVITGKGSVTVNLANDDVVKMLAEYTNDGVWRFTVKEGERYVLILPEVGEDDEDQPRYDNDGCPKYSEKAVISETVASVKVRKLRS